MEQKEDEPPPFWLQSTTTLRQVDRHRRRHRHASSLLFNTGVLVIVLLVTAIVFLVIVIPSVLSLARQVFNPSLVKSSWNSLNIVLVLFAIVCGFLGRKQDDDQTPVNTPKKRSDDQVDLKYNDYQDRMSYNNNSFTRFRRNSISYPDLRQESPWMMIKENRWRFSDDTDVQNHQISPTVIHGEEEQHSDVKNIEVNSFRNKTHEVSPPSTPSPAPSVVDEDEAPPPSRPTDQEIIHGGSEQMVGEDESSIKTIEMVDASKIDQPKVVPPAYLLPPPSPTSYYWPPPSPPPPPPPPPPRRAQSSMATKKKTNQTYEMVGHGIYRWNSSAKREPKSKAQLPPQPQPRPPSPQRPPPGSWPEVGQYSEQRQESSDRKKGGVTKDFFSSFYHHHQSKRKRKQKRRSYENLEEIIQPPNSSIYRSKSTPEFPPPSPPPPPPPPLPPPPHSVFHNMFSKKGKSKKKVHSITPSSTPPPPPPPPRRPPLSSAVKPTTRRQPVTKTVSFSRMDENAGSGSESPINPIPPPPPPPPFKMKPWQFVMQGDYMNVESNNSSPRSGYSASEDEGNSPSNNNSPVTPPLFCPSPDVNTKADDFIARFRAKLKLEKLDSIKLKQGTGPSRLGPDSAQP